MSARRPRRATRSSPRRPTGRSSAYGMRAGARPRPCRSVGDAARCIPTHTGRGLGTALCSRPSDAPRAASAGRERPVPHAASSTDDAGLELFLEAHGYRHVRSFWHDGSVRLPADDAPVVGPRRHRDPRVRDCADDERIAVRGPRGSFHDHFGYEPRTRSSRSSGVVRGIARVRPVARVLAFGGDEASASRQHGRRRRRGGSATLGVLRTLAGPGRRAGAAPAVVRRARRARAHEVAPRRRHREPDGAIAAVREGGHDGATATTTCTRSAHRRVG